MAAAGNPRVNPNPVPPLVPVSAPTPTPAGGRRICAMRWLAIIVLLLGVLGTLGVAFGSRRTAASGRVLESYAEQLSTQDGVLAIAHLRIENHSGHRINLHGVKLRMETATGSYEADASSLIDYERYTEAYALLRMHAGNGLDPESTIEPGATLDGSVLVIFPVGVDQFEARRSLTADVSTDHDLLIRLR